MPYFDLCLECMKEYDVYSSGSIYQHLVCSGACEERFRLRKSEDEMNKLDTLARNMRHVYV